MSWFNNLSISKKLGVAFLTVIPLMVILGVSSIVELNSIDKHSNTLRTDYIPCMRQVASMDALVSDYRRYELRLLIEDSREGVDKFAGKMEKTQSELNDSQAKYAPGIADEEEKKIFADFTSDWDKYIGVSNNILKLVRDGKRAEAKALLQGESHKAFDDARAKMEEDIDFNMKAASGLAAEMEAIYQSSWKWITGVLTVSVLMGLLITVVIIKSIKDPLQRLMDVSGKIIDGDLTATVAVTGNDELGQLGRRYNEMGLSLQETMKKIGEAAVHLASSSTQLSATSEQISRGASDQDSQATQVAAAMEQMSATVMEVARNSAEAADSAREASTTAKDGGGIVDKTVGRMEKIAKATQETGRIIDALGQSSDKIGEIISVINDIADQTNLLALNAAIEAARAGEQGRGFAVVADEVRKLAERTTKATKEIAVMINTIQDDTSGAVRSMAEGGKEVEEGVELAREAGRSLENIVQKADRVTEMVQRIAAASEQQSTASEQISGNVENIAGVIKQNASAVHESSTAAQELANLAQELQGLVSRFKVGETSHAPRAAAQDPAFTGNVINGRALFKARSVA